MKREIHFRRPTRWDVNGMVLELREFYSRKLMYFVQRDDFNDQMISFARLHKILRKSIFIEALYPEYTPHLFFFSNMTLRKYNFLYIFT